MSEREAKPSTPAESADEESEDRERWIALMAGHVEKLGIQQGVHDYAKYLGSRERP